MLQHGKNKQFVIVDPSLVNFSGHHYNYSIAVYREISSRGYVPYILSHHEFPAELTENMNIIPTFQNRWQNAGLLHSGGVVKAINRITMGLPGPIRSKWISFLWGTKQFIRSPSAPRDFSSFITDFSGAITNMDAENPKHFFFHTLHADALTALVSANFTAVNDCRYHMSFVMRSDPPQGESLLQLQAALEKVAKSGRWPASMSFFTDTEELCELYNNLSLIKFRRLPIPLEFSHLDNKARPGKQKDEKQCLTLAYLGDARREKGYHLLPKLVRELSDLFKGGQVRLLHQCCFHVPGGEPGMAEAKAELVGWPASLVQAIDTPLSPRAYLELMQSADIILLPYDASLYRARSSGILAEALALGIPAVVPQYTWMHRQVSERLGVAFSGPGEFPSAVRSAIEHFHELREDCMDQRDDWRDKHSPKRLVDMLLQIDTSNDNAGGTS